MPFAVERYQPLKAGSVNLFQSTSSHATNLNHPKLHQHSKELEFAKAAYLSPDERVQQFQGSDYQIQNDFNTDEFYSVIHNGTLYNVHRGSSTKEDWTQTDVQLALGDLPDSDRFKRSKALSAAATRKFGLPTVEVGHSLGGSLAERIALEHGTESTVFNQGTSPLLSYGHINRRRNRHFRMSGDAISQFDPTATVLQNNSTGATLGKLATNLFLPSASPLVGTYQNHTLSAFNHVAATD